MFLLCAPLTYYLFPNTALTGLSRYLKLWKKKYKIKKKTTTVLVYCVHFYHGNDSVVRVKKYKSPSGLYI